MSEFIVATDGLTHQYPNGEYAISEVGLKVPAGSIFGFLGPNGAGKTTTLKLLLGLLRKQQGSIRIFGKDLEVSRVQVLAQTGSLIESPSVYGHLSAMDNMKVLGLLNGVPKSRWGRVLEITGLGQTGNKKAGQFSLGMKQRLGLAMALMHQPPLLVLDEPTNGLDPSGIIEMRELLKLINKEEGTTLLVSSHLLPEMEKLATHTAIIHGGQLMFQGTMDDLLQRRNAGNGWMLRSADPMAALLWLKTNGYKAVPHQEQVMIKDLVPGNVNALLLGLIQAGIKVYGLAESQQDLESIFMQIIHPQS
jgi:ABC-2 type transport system ATP-binding protein